jgi:glycosyltransferase involved in cell wall biosynthesis
VKEKLLIFNLLHGPNIDDLTPESNSWYLKNYECCFNEVYHLSLAGPGKPSVINGRSVYHLAGTGKNAWDLIVAPFRLFRRVKKIKPDYIITYEQVWGWWAALFVRMFTRRKVYLLPLTFPEQMYKVTGKAISSKLPIWFERKLLNLSYRICNKVITSENLGNYTAWMKENKVIKKKLILTKSLPESVVFPAFTKRLNELKNESNYQQKTGDIIRLVYVGRLHVEKMTDHLIKALPLIRAAVPNIRLRIIGAGPDKDLLERMIKENEVDDITELLDYVPHGQLPDLLLSSDVFVSPSTGHAFREAAICGLPIVAYNIDWIKGFLTHEENFYGTETIDYKKFSEDVITVANDLALRKKLSSNIELFAERYWSAKNLPKSLEKIFV